MNQHEWQWLKHKLASTPEAAPQLTTDHRPVINFVASVKYDRRQRTTLSIDGSCSFQLGDGTRPLSVRARRVLNVHWLFKASCLSSNWDRDKLRPLLFSLLAFGQPLLAEVAASSGSLSSLSLFFRVWLLLSEEAAAAAAAAPAAAASTATTGVVAP